MCQYLRDGGFLPDGASRSTSEVGRGLIELLIPHYDNLAGQAVVGFEAVPSPSPVAGERFLTIRGERASLIGDTACGTCEFLFEKLGGATRTFEEEAASVSVALRNVREMPSAKVLSSLGRLLPPGDYAVALLTARPHLVMPADELDYFQHEAVELFGIDPYYGAPHSPRTPYYRLCTLAWPHDGLIVELSIPLQQPGALDPETVERYKVEIQEGGAPAAFAVGILDIRQPADWEGDPEVTRLCFVEQYLCWMVIT